MIKISNLKKSYGNKEVLKNINLEIKEGDFVGLVGKNGSGKSTIINILSMVKTQDSGKISYSFDEKEIYKNMGIQFQEADFDKRMKVKELAGLWKEIYKVKDDYYNELIRLLELDQVMNQKIGNISGGQRQKLNIFLALIHNPKVLILDELTTGLDAISRAEIRKYLSILNKEKGKTILMVSHYMDEVENLCNKVCFLKDGVISEEGSPNELIKKHNCKNLEQLVVNYL